MTIAQLKKIMKKKDMTYRDVADLVGLGTKGAISHWFTRGSVPRHWHKVLKEKLN